MTMINMPQVRPATVTKGEDPGMLDFLKKGLAGGVGTGLGSGLGMLLGGPPGAAVGGAVGGSVGGAVGEAASPTPTGTYQQQGSVVPQAQAMNQGGQQQNQMLNSLLVRLMRGQG
jgi:hypothetical protein